MVALPTKRLRTVMRLAMKWRWGLARAGIWLRICSTKVTGTDGQGLGWQLSLYPGYPAFGPPCLRSQKLTGPLLHTPT